VRVLTANAERDTRSANSIGVFECAGFGGS